MFFVRIIVKVYINVFEYCVCFLNFVEMKKRKMEIEDNNTFLAQIVGGVSNVWEGFTLFYFMPHCPM